MDEPNDYGSFTIEFKLSGQPIFMAVHPEMAPARVGIKPTERYFIYCIHPERGTCTWYMEQDDNLKWVSDQYPPFIDQKLIAWVGIKIESNDDN